MTASRKNPDLEWREPPSTVHGRTRWIPVLTPVMARPGRWAMVYRCSLPRQATKTASNLRIGLLQTPPGKWEFAADSKTGEVFAKYIGPE